MTFGEDAMDLFITVRSVDNIVLWRVCAYIPLDVVRTLEFNYEKRCPHTFGHIVNFCDSYMVVVW